ncbi:MAG: LVIVD repeat-containing protein, partial [Candidatus Heimdallarchaeaceae archaeon]
LNTSAYTYKTKFEFYNVSNRNAFIDYSTKISYNYVPNNLVFDVVYRRIPIAYSEDGDYVVFANKKMYILNENDSTLDPNTEITNFNYMWPYYIKHFGNGSEYGFQAYIAAYLIQSELKDLQTEHGYTDSELAYLTLNRNYAISEGVLSHSIYLPHKWIYVRPAFYDLNFDQATSYRILYNATYNGHDYSLFTGEAGSVKFFLDLVKGLYYSPDELSVNVVQLLADIYNIDTPLEIEYAKSFAAYLEFLLGKPALQWLYDHKISYVCKRTALEWIVGIPDPLLDNRVFPLVKNDTLDDFDRSTDMFYAERTGASNVTQVGQIIAVANVPYYEYDQSESVIIENGLAYVTNGNRGLRIVNISDPLMLGIGQYSNMYDAKAVAVEGSTAYVAQGSYGLLVLNTTDPSAIEMLARWTDNGNVDFNDVEKIVVGGTSNPITALLLANGQYGITVTTLEQDGYVGTAYRFVNTTGPALSARAYTGTNSRIYVAEGTSGLDVISMPGLSSMSLAYHYDFNNFTELQNVIKVQPTTGYLYVLDAVNGLLIFSDSNGNLTLQGQLDYGTGSPYTSLYVASSTRVYLTQGEDGLVVVDVSNKQNPTVVSRFDDTAGHKGSAMDVIVGDDGYIYLADYSEGLVQLMYSGNQFSVLNTDELRTYVEAWNSPSKGQFTNWPVNSAGVAAGYKDVIHEVYDSHTLYPNVKRGLRLQWSEHFLRPFFFSSLRDVALKAGMTVFAYTAEYDNPYLQLEQFDYYWMTAADFFNTTFMHVGYWNELYDENYSPMDFLITHSFPGEVRDAAIHVQQMWVEPITGTVVGLRDRVQYNTLAISYLEHYSLLNESLFTPQELMYHQYQTWHQTYPGLTGDMARLFWQEDEIEITEYKAESIKTTYLHRISTADASRTTGAFSALAITTAGFVLSSLVMAKLAEVPSKKKK